MRFEYEITADEYAAGQLLYQELSRGRRRFVDAACWILAGLALIAIAWDGRVVDWAPIVLVGMGTICIYSGAVNLFPMRYFRRKYPDAELTGKRFEADVSEDGFEESGDYRSSRVQWRGVRLKGENDRVFMLYSGGSIFIFGKKYLNEEQQQELRKLAGLKL